jgi:hypothetical protein
MLQAHSDAKEITMGKPKKTTKGVKRRTAKFVIDRKGGMVVLLGRGRFTGAGKRIKVRKTEDRRHMLHLSEQLKPVMERVFTVLEKENNFDESKTLALLRKKMAEHGMKRLPNKLNDAYVRIADEVNSSAINLVPDDASINKAIEHLRADLRKYQVVVGTTTNDTYMDGTAGFAAAQLRKLHTLADETFAAKNEGTPIQNARDVMTSSVRQLIHGCESPASVYELVKDLIFSVTFDLSAKAKRENTARMLRWQRTVLALAEGSGRDQLDALFRILPDQPSTG